MASDPGPKEGEWGGTAAGPFGLHLEPEGILNFSCCSGTNLCKAAKNEFWSQLFTGKEVHVTAQSKGGNTLPGEEAGNWKAACG